MTETAANSASPEPRLGNRILRQLRSLLIGYVIVVSVVWLIQRKLLYHPTTASVLSVRDSAELQHLYPAARDVTLTCEDGVHIGAWLLQKDDAAPRDSGRPLVILFHGNAGHRGHRTGWYQVLEDAGADVFAVDYHGYGDSKGNISESAVELDALASWKFVTEELGYRNSDIIVMGVSLGGAPAVFLSSQQSLADQPPAALLTVATFSSMTDVACDHYPWLPVRFMLSDQYPSAEYIRNITCRYLSLHGDCDEIVAQEFGRRLFSCAPEQSVVGVDKQWIELPGCHHNDLLPAGLEHIRPALHRLVADVRQQMSE